jgi:excisionase family DNA binding protein
LTVATFHATIQVAYKRKEGQNVVMASDEILDVKEVATILKVSTRTVIRLAERDELVSFKVGDLWRFRRSDVDDFIQRQIDRRQKGDRDQ